MKNLRNSILFGAAGALLAGIKFSIPGLEGGTSDAREIAALLSVLFLSKWPFALLTGILVSLGGPYNAVGTTAVMHTAAIPAAWFFHQYIRKKDFKLMAGSVLWGVFVLLLYPLVFSPLFSGMSIISGSISPDEFSATYITFLKAVGFEAVFTSLFTALIYAVILSSARLEKTNRRLKEEIRNNTRMKSELIKAAKEQSISSLAGGIAHDFNNIITGISGSLNLISLSASADAQIARAVDIAQKACRRAATLTKELLILSEGGVPEWVNVSLPELIQETADFLIRSPEIKTCIDLPENLAAVSGDRTQIEQVFQNLIINARQAISGPGEIRISGRNISEGTGQGVIREGAYTEISISDTGSGINPENLERIFDPYFSTKKGGTGLGLAIINSIVKQHGGYISVDSVPGSGTVFTLLFPVEPEQNGSNDNKKKEQ